MNRAVFGGVWALIFLGNLLVNGPWAGFHAILLGGLGLLMLCFPPDHRIPRLWWLLAAAFASLGAASFLPAGWFPQPAWRRELAELGVNTGGQVAIQTRHAAESYGLFLLTLLAGLWLVGHRTSSSQVRHWALTFTLGVAAYAVISKLRQPTPDALFGFFPNRNHSATYLAMGSICGLGCVLQALRDRRFVALGIALVATATCLWAVAGWSLSRGGVVLVALGCLLWLPMLGRRYLGSHGLRAIGLIALAGLGMFFLADSGVKERLSKTVEKATARSGERSAEASAPIDFRIPIARDTWALIRDFPVTGVGAGQFRYIFPQYREQSAILNDSDSHHPESDWLWMVSETGIPATVALLALVGAASVRSLRSILTGRERALRGACLVAALLVPFHGVFDVPGHRITLALAAVFLFALSLRPREDAVEPDTRKWAGRLLSLAPLAAAALLATSQWFGGPTPAVLVPRLAVAQAQELYQKDRSLPAAPDSSSGAEDLLERALQVLDSAEEVMPLDREVRHHQGFLSLHFEDLLAEARTAFGVERALDPTWIQSPLRQAHAWSAVDPQESALLAREAIRRAKAQDARSAAPENAVSLEDRTRQQIREAPAFQGIPPEFLEF